MQWAPTPASGSSMLGVPEPADGPPSPLGALRPSGGEMGGLGSLSSPPWSARDPRTSSTQSLVPSTVDGDGDDHKRRLLVVYIHGFMGNNSSFRSFPAHVHAFLKVLLAETHAIHTKIYPRYKTYKSIDVARDNFSKWLAPHESPTTDVVLVGHSMGGLLAADVVLLPSQSPYNASSPFRHRILGTISLDAPLLGLHPGIVVSGIASLFRPAPSPPGMNQDAQTDHVNAAQSLSLSPDPSIYSEVSPSSGVSSPTLSSYPSNATGSPSAAGPRDPYFDPPFPNDVAFVDRGWFKNIVHFATKHKEENLVYAAASHIVSHLEFGVCLANYPELQSRYNRLRKLEDVDDWRQPGGVRVRFVNYYTVSTGVIKNPRSPSPDGSPRRSAPRGDSERSSRETESLAPTPRRSAEGSYVQTPRISIEEYSDEPGRESLQILEPIPEPELEPEPEPKTEPESEPGPKTESKPELEPNTELAPELAEPSSPPPEYEEINPNPEPTALSNGPPPDDPTTNDPDLPPIPDVPNPPTPPDLDAYPDKEARKQAQKTFKAALKAHAHAVKARDKALKDRQKTLDKQRRQALKLEKKQAKLLQKPPPSPQETDQPFPGEERQMEKEREEEKKKKPPRRRKFCMLPSKSGSARDPAWVEVYMEGVDEVGAHCGLFVPGPHYERLVGDVGERIAGWVWEEASRRVVLAGEEEGVTGGV